MIKKGFSMIFSPISSRRQAVFFALFLFTYAQVEVVQATWDPSDVIPHPVHIGEASDEERELARQYREGMIKSLSYWKKRGLTEPPQLTGFIHFTSFEETRVIEVFEALNDQLPDVREYLFEQYDYYQKTKLYHFLEQKQSAGPLGGALGIFMKVSSLFNKNLNRGVMGLERRLADVTFEQLIQMRFGFAVPHLMKAIENDWTVQEAYQKSGSHRPWDFYDNAFYAALPQVDLQTLLPEVREDSAYSWKDMSEVIHYEVLEQIFLGLYEVGFGRKIVILPRTTEGVGDTEVSTLRDQTVGDHELGHHTNHSIADFRDVHRLVDEVLADYLSVAPMNEPEVGSFFAEASGIIAERLTHRLQTEVLPEDKINRYVQMIHGFAGISRQGLLRDMSAKSQIDTLKRFYEMPNDYDAGNPLRYFLWSIREAEGVQPEQFDEVVLATIQEFTLLPLLLSPGTQKRLWARQAWISVRQGAASLSAQLRGESESRFFEKEQEREVAQMRRLVERQEDYGLGKRPPIQADYITPEFVRALYRTAGRIAPRLQSQIAEQAEELMHSHALKISMHDGSKELVFVRRSWNQFNPLARHRLKTLLSRLRKSQEIYQREGFAKWPEEKKIEFYVDYAKNLDRLLEFERTGETHRLFIARPAFGLLMLAAESSTSLIGDVLNVCDLLLTPEAFGKTGI
jgi:hypothetical protein